MNDLDLILQALTDRIHGETTEQLGKVKETEKYYTLERVTSVQGGNVMTDSGKSLSCVLNGGQVAVGEEILVVKTKDGRFLGKESFEGFAIAYDF